MEKKRRGFLFCLLLLLLCGCTAANPENEYAHYDFYAMDTAMSLTLGGDDTESVAQETEQLINRLEAELSRTREDSLVSKLNRGEKTDDAELAALLSLCREFSTATDGAFDVTVADIVSAWGFTTETQQVPEEAELAALLPYVGSDGILLEGSGVCLSENVHIDLGGVAKGYASDRVRSLWDELEVESGLAALGGNIYCRGTKADGTLWSVAIRNPAEDSGSVGMLHLSDCFAVTSGGYERYFEENGKIYHHIIDPATGYPAESGLLSVTIVSSSGTQADALSTALFVMGEEKALAFWRSDRSFDFVLVAEDGRILATEGLEGCFDSFSEGYTYEFVR